jgi:hypothetical protein
MNDFGQVDPGALSAACASATTIGAAHQRTRCLRALPNRRRRLIRPYLDAVRQWMFATVRLQELPSKTRRRLLRSVTWADVHGAFNARKPLRLLIGLVTRLGHRFGIRDPRSRGSVVLHRIRRRHLIEHSQNGLEDRWGARVQVNLPVRLSAIPLVEVDGCMKSLSLSGALMEAECDLRLHTLIEVRFDLPLPLSRVAVLNAHVSRKLKRGVGIEWCEFAPNVVKELMRAPSVRFPR